MSVIVRFTVPAEQFPLGDVLDVTNGPRIRLEAVIPTGEGVIPYFWVPTSDADSVTGALEQAPLVDEVRAVDEVTDETLVRVSWSADVNGFIEAISECDGVILQGEGLGDEWTFQVRFAEHEAVSAFYRTCLDRGISLTLDELNHRSGRTDDAEVSLTKGQREALLLALESGYFEVPRAMTLQELAEQLDISDTALSQRLRRGLTAILDATIREPTTRADEDDG